MLSVNMDGVFLVAIIILVTNDFSAIAIQVTPTVVTPVTSNGICYSKEEYNNITKTIIQKSKDLLEGVHSNIGCSENDGSWKQIVFLNMSDSSHSCPDSWSTFNLPIRGCGRKYTSASSEDAGASCNSAFYSSNGTYFSQICGRINGYQFGNPNAFNSSINGSIGLESWYIDGLSLTHGAPGTRQHVWSFVNAWYDVDVMPSHEKYACPCMYSNISQWPHSVPSFVGTNYFCDAGNRHEIFTAFLTQDLLWDGAGCGGNGTTCCDYNEPPWFFRRLDVATSDDLEVRICADQYTTNENTIITHMELYVK